MKNIKQNFHRFLLSGGTLALLAGTMPMAASAQWLNFKTPGIPRTADGKPNLAAPAPKTADGKPDFTGLWNNMRGENPPARGEEATENVLNYMPKGTVLPFQPWAEAVYKEHLTEAGAGARPSGYCLPHTIPDAYVHGGPKRIVQTPTLIAILYEQMTHFRQIFMDGRGHPDVKLQAWYGYSTGKWDGDALVVDTVGFNDRSWLDDAGHPHTDALHTTERFTRPDFGHMNIQITIDDPKAYTKPWTENIRFQLAADTDMLEDVCDNEQDAHHYSSK
ncbi:MAG: hypothetical protein ABSG41_10870 [Bryobacteraceae bacterium]